MSDTNNNLVRAVASNGTINTITGAGSGTGSGQNGVGGETLTFNGASSIAYGSAATFTVIFSNAGKIATGQVNLVDPANNLAPAASATLSNNVATISVSTLSAGTHNLVVAFAGDSQNAEITSSPLALTVTPLPVIATANALTLQYGQTIPAITGTLSSVLPQDANNVTAVFTTSATAASPVNQYQISGTLAGPAAIDYTVALDAASGSTTIGKAASTITLISSNPAQFAGVPVTLTAQAASSTTGTPTGIVSFYDGTTLLISTPIVNGSATYTSSGLAGGAHSLTTVYSGDANFTAAPPPQSSRLAIVTEQAPLTSHTRSGALEQKLTFSRILS